MAPFTEVGIISFHFFSVCPNRHLFVRPWRRADRRRADGALRRRLPDELQFEEEQEDEAADPREGHEEADQEGLGVPRRLARLLRAQHHVSRRPKELQPSVENRIVKSEQKKSNETLRRRRRRRRKKRRGRH